MTPPDPPGFTGSPLDRADALRADPERIAVLVAAPAARLLRLAALDPELDDAGALVWGSLAEAPAGAPLAFLGLLDGAPHFVALGPAPSAGRRSHRLNAMLGVMPPAEAATFAAARSLVDWHARHRFCPACAGPTAPIRAGWARRCSACGTEHFPRTDPVVIMLAEHRGRVLVGRQASWPAGRFSALAGFVEVGESIAEAVARELFEEAGIRARDVRVVTSQPWPFPSQLMIACLAATDDDTLVLAPEEIEAAMWVDRTEVAAALSGAPDAPFLAPPAYAIAHTLLASWLTTSRFDA